VTPVIRDCHKLTIPEIEKTLAELGKKARESAITIEELSGGTFTISNGGVFGSMMGTPILNMPQVAILGMHAIKDRPIAVDGQVVIKPMMYLALTYDHRIVDGREAVTFLVRVKQLLEQPERVLYNI
jgi:2-oxoglutarate dehydrogenase E2 component (dihydrolipoamide succinyltransferase)